MPHVPVPVFGVRFCKMLPVFSNIILFGELFISFPGKELTHVPLFNICSVQSGSTIDDLYEDLRDGFKLLSLLEILSGTPLVSQHDKKV